MLLDLRLKIIDFVKKHKNKIFIGLIILIIIISVNAYLGRKKELQPPKVNYEPHNPIVSGNKVKSKKEQTNIEDSIKKYMDFCNNKDYQSAYDLISEDCKKEMFKEDLEEFKKYIDYIFDGNKIYTIQDYSNKDNIYVYQVTISEDIMATGMNNENSENVYKEKIVLKKENNGFRLSVGGFISNENIQYISEDDNMRITVENKITYYDKIIYKMKVKNKTNYTILFSKKKEEECFGISLDGELREEELDNYSNNERYIPGGETKELQLTFNKYFDETEVKETKITFNKIRILEEYTGVEEKWEDEITNKLFKQYSISFKVK